MYRSDLFGIGMISCLLMFVSSPALAANAPTPTAMQEPNVEAAVEGTSKKIGIIEASRKKMKAAETAESVDCFYDANKYHADCRNTRVETR